jgi:4,5-dihydroxyphthalate decarboxylase
MRGILQHEYGVLPTEIHWRSGGQEEPGRGERTPLKPIPGLDLKPIGKEETLVGMLREGELDALFTARGPSSFLRGEPHIKRLFPNTREAEQAYYKKPPHVPDHASRRHPQGAGAEISVAADQRVQGVL